MIVAAILIAALPIPNDGIDDTAAIQALLDAAGTSSVVRLVAGVYDVSAPISVYARHLEGEHHSLASQGTVLRWASSSTPAIECSDVYPAPKFDASCQPADYASASILYGSHGRVQIRNLVIEANGVPFGVYLRKAFGPQSVLQNVSVSGASRAGIWLDQCSLITLDRTETDSNRDGLVVSGSNGARVLGSVARYNSRHGIVVTVRDGESGSGGINLVGSTVEHNACDGIRFVGTHSRSVVSNTWNEANGWHAFRAISAWNVVIRDNTIIGGSAKRAIYVSDCDGCRIVGNRVAASVHGWEDFVVESSAYLTVRDNLYSSSHVAEYLGSGNWFRVYVDDVAFSPFAGVQTDYKGDPK